MSPSSKQRTTWAMASTSRMLARNWLPRPSPFEAPRTRPAMSTKVSRVGMICCGLRDRRELVEPRIGHRDLADIRLDGAERIIRRLRRRRLRQRVEERRLADIGQSDDAAFETHCVLNISSPSLAGLSGHPRLVVCHQGRRGCPDIEREDALPLPGMTDVVGARVSPSCRRLPVSTNPFACIARCTLF